MNKQNNWREKIRERCYNSYPQNFDEIIPIVEHEIEKARDEGFVDMDNHDKLIRNEVLQLALERIEELEQIFMLNKDRSIKEANEEMAYKSGYNSALSEIQSIIKSLMEE